MSSCLSKVKGRILLAKNEDGSLFEFIDLLNGLKDNGDIDDVAKFLDYDIEDFLSDIEFEFIKNEYLYINNQFYYLEIDNFEYNIHHSVLDDLSEAQCNKNNNESFEFDIYYNYCDTYFPKAIQELFDEVLYQI